MRTKFAQWPPYKSCIRKAHGYLSFNCSLINLDVVGISLLKSKEVVVIYYRGAWKRGYLYEGDKLSPQQVFKIFCDVPESADDLEKYEKEYEGRIEILVPPRDNYVFINEMEVVQKK